MGLREYQRKRAFRKTREGDPQAGLERGSLDFVLTGRKLKGTWTFVRMRGETGNPKRNWLLIKRSDRSRARAH